MSVTRKGAIIAAILCIMLLSLPAVSSEASTSVSTTCGNVDIVALEDAKKMNIKETIDLTIHFYNNNTEPVSVQMVELDSNPVNIFIEDEIFVVDAQSGKDVVVGLNTSEYTKEGSYDVVFGFNVVKGGVKDPTTGSFTINVNVSSMYSSTTSYCKFMGIFDNPLSSPWNHPITTALISFAVWVCIGLVASLMARMVFSIILKRLNTTKKYYLKRIGIFTFSCVVVYGITNCLHIINADEMIVANYQRISTTLNILTVAALIWTIFKALIRLYLTQNEDDDDTNDVDESLIPLVNMLGKVIIIAMTVAIVMFNLGFNPIAILTGAGLTSIGLSFGVKPAINELFSGLVVLTSRPFKVGETIKIGSESALEVRRVGLLKTELITNFTNEKIVVPNSKIMASNITNLTCGTRRYRKVIFIKAPYETNIALARKLIKQAAMEHEHVMKDGSVPKPSVMFYSQKEMTSITFRLAFYVDEYGDASPIAGELYTSIINKFRENGISVARHKRIYTLYEMGGGTDA